MTILTHIRQPYHLVLLLALIPAAVTAWVRYKRLTKSMVQVNYTGKRSRSLSLKTRLVARIINWSLAYACVIIALCDPVWGTRQVPVHTNGSAVSFVFDISYSMMAEDVADLPGVTRLEAAQTYATSLLDHLEGTSISTVIAKGSGVTAVPLTEDQVPTRSLISQLSPAMITAAGSNLGSGIETAIKSFPLQSNYRQTIVLFTDGDETTNSNLQKAAIDAAKYGITVIFAGFGSETESTVLAGDGKTTVQTALRSELLSSVVEAAKEELPLTHTQLVWYIPAYQTGSAAAIVKLISGNGPNSTQTGYRVEDIEQYRTFLLLALLFFIAGFLFSELHIPESKSGHTAKTAVLLMSVLLPLLDGCTASLNQRMSVLNSTRLWHQKQYQKATAGFLSVLEDAQQTNDTATAQYGLYGLATTYVMQNEQDSALERFKEIVPDAPNEILFAAAYNAGIIEYQKGNFEQAAYCFKTALLQDSTSVDAKINLELSLRQNTTSKNEAKQEMIPVSESEHEAALNDVIFSVIKESEQNRWISPETQTESNQVLDY